LKIEDLILNDTIKQKDLKFDNEYVVEGYSYIKSTSKIIAKNRVFYYRNSGNMWVYKPEHANEEIVAATFSDITTNGRITIPKGRVAIITLTRHSFERPNSLWSVRLISEQTFQHLSF
jgi:hypothetical protein